MLVIYVHFVFQKLGPRENLKIFQCFAGFFVVVVVVVFRFFFFLFLFFCATWKVVCLQFRMFLLFFSF